MKRIVTALLLSILVLCAVPISALASSNVIDVNAVCTLNLEYMDTKQPMDGVQFLLYRVADVDADMKFSWTHTFEEYGLNPDPKQALSLSRTLAAYVARDGLSPTDITVTDTTGKATFSGLNTGMYATPQSLHWFSSPSPALTVRGATRQISKSSSNRLQ